MLCLICYIIFFKYICRYFFVKSLLYKYIDDINSIIDIEIIEVWIIDVILYTCKKNIIIIVMNLMICHEKKSIFKVNHFI